MTELNCLGWDSDRSISPVSTLKISNNESDDQLVMSVWSSDLRRFEVKEFTSYVSATFKMGSERNLIDFFQKFFPD